MTPQATSTSPIVELLIRRWAMPEARTPTVERLLRACADGGTALRIDPAEAEADWGGSLGYATTASDESPSPLILRDIGGVPHLQTWACHAAETAIARSVLARVRHSLSQRPRLQAETLERLRLLFERPDDPNPDPQQGQLNAARTALTHHFTLITGGPGTGKTSTLARILALLLDLHDPENPPRVALGAPTGKAAGRMREAVEKAVGDIARQFPDLQEPLAKAARSSTTLHRLLGYNPATGNCARNAANPLALDILVIDEASMIDVHLWRALLEATPLQTRILVLGDPCQLESVAAGRVLSDMVDAAQGGSLLEHCWAHLHKSYRFEKRPDIAALANNIGFQDADAVEALLRRRHGLDAPGGVAWLGDTGGSLQWQHLPPSVRDGILDIARAATPAASLAALGKVCILSAHREHAHGAEGLSAMITRHLHEEFAKGVTEAAHNEPNIPIIINKNDPETGLSNGSVGVLCAGSDGERLAWFPNAVATATPRRFMPGKLPEHSAAWALTIHRSQGSEYDNVLVLLPRGDSPLATRELIYTAITRARETVYLCGPLDAVRAAVLSEQTRLTCLRDMLEEK